MKSSSYSYVTIDSYETRNERGGRCPRTINVPFAPGASSAQLIRKLWPQWGGMKRHLNVSLADGRFWKRPPRFEPLAVTES
jgi:hypothetical protein